MSVTFTSNAPVASSYRWSPCLCAQMLDNYSEVFRASEDRKALKSSWKAALAKEANKSCFMCKGTGVELEVRSEVPEINWANANAHVMFQLLGWDFGDGLGKKTIPEARRALMRARARNLRDFVREPETVHGKPRKGADGTVQLRPVRVYSAGLDVGGIQDRLEKFGKFVEDSAKLGATKISWS